MIGLRRWTGLEPLPEGQTILLEASAGTGKTWQIEALVVRLVAEYDVSIDQILVITFTNAATAELRDRIRKRLVAARDAMDSQTAPSDPILEHLWNEAVERATRRSRLAVALSDFDLAPISTIHGFSQRMLDQLAFQSGQEPGLELMADPGPILDELVDDELAAIFAEANEAELTVLRDMGFVRDRLHELAKAMTQAVQPALEPEVPVHAGPEPAALMFARRWLDLRLEVADWIEGEEGNAALAALAEELASKTRRLDGRKLPAKTLMSQTWPHALEWISGIACRSDRKDDKKLAKFTLETLEAAWKGTQAELQTFAARPLFVRISDLLKVQDQLWPMAAAEFAARARDHVERELVRSGRLTYGSMLSRLAERIAEESGEPEGGPLARAIRSRFRAALVDEFQDTDGAQWPVMRAVFAHPQRRLLIIGDPKQAIYAFRGADVHVYLDAAKVADDRATMDTNWRSDQGYVKAMNHLWWQDSGAFELDDVDYVDVACGPKGKKQRIRGLPNRGDRKPRPFELRWIDGRCIEQPELTISSKELGREVSAQMAAREAARLLSAGAEILDDPDGDDPQWRRLAPGDIAVLVRTNLQAERIGGHLQRLGIPSVSAGRGSVMASPVVSWVCAWLDAVAAPGRDRPARALATTPLFGWTAVDLASALADADALSPAMGGPAASDRWDRWLSRIQAWSQAWFRRGFVRVFEQALGEFDVVSRLLGARQGERHATDLRHLIELCHSEERRTRVGPAALATWLRAAREDAGSGEDDAQALRLESDARAVQLVTIHKSKGLEYPIVLLPFVWDELKARDRGGPIAWHRHVGGRSEIALNLEVSGTPGRERATERAATEARQEQQRLLYVALTRARHHCVAWLGPLGGDARDTEGYAMGRIALRPRGDSGAPADEGDVVVFPDKPRSNAKANTVEAYHDQCAAALARATDRLDGLASSSSESVGWSVEAPLSAPQRMSPRSTEASQLRAQPWPTQRQLASPWQVSSYSAMVAGRTFDASEPQRREELVHRDEDGQLAEDVEAQVDLVEPSVGASGLDAPIASAGLQGGAGVGTWAHAVLEHLDFQDCVAEDGRSLAELLAELGVRHGVRSPAQHDLLAEVLPRVLDTPLDGGSSGLPRGYSLRALERSDRLDELGFDLRLGAGNLWRAGGGDGVVNEPGVRLALASRAPEDGWGGEAWLRAILDRAHEQDRPVLPRIAGILTGFIDLTFRAELDGGLTRYFVADYKTNRIGPINHRRDSRRVHYTQPWLDWEMAHHGYHLQSLLYTVALHRMLGQRLPDYRYEHHIGGHFYLFLRGMEGASAARDGGWSLGVLHDRWPASVVLGLDAALGGRPTQEVAEIVEAAASQGGAA